MKGLIKSPDFNQDGLYDDFMYCNWKILPVDGHLIEIDIPFIRLYPQDDCDVINNDELIVSIVP